MLKAVIVLVLILLSELFDEPLRAAEVGARREPPVIHAMRADSALVVDGALDEAAWAKAQLAGEFHQIEPDEYAPASEATEVRVLYDDVHLYIGARMYDSAPATINAKQLIQGRRYLFDDRVHVLLDPFLDRRNGYFFQLNPNGVRRDGLIENNETFIEDWDGLWQAAARVDSHGWTAEMAIPFRSISYDRMARAWGINFGRLVPRKDEQTAWSSQGNEVFELAPSIAGELRAVEAPPRGLGVDLVPALVLRDFEDRTRRLTATDLEPSLDLFYAPSSRFTLAATVNTDFSATEIDDRQVNLTRFSLFFPEKRDFFLQDAGIFEFAGLEENGRPFFSRRIGLDASGLPLDLRGGLKATARTGAFNFGVLSVRQDSATSGGTKDLIVARGSRNVLEESALGFIATQGDPLSSSDSSLIGTDFRYRDPDAAFGRPVRGSLWLQRSDTAGISSEELAFGGALELPGDRHQTTLSFSELQQNFRPALGFVNRVDIRHYEAEHRFRMRPVRSSLLRFDTTAGYELVTDRDNRLLSRLLLATLETATRERDQAGLNVEWATEVLDAPFEIAQNTLIPAGRYDFGGALLYLESGDQRAVSGRVELGAGEFYDGHRRQARLELNLRPTRHYSLGLVWDQNDVRLPAGSFTTRLAQLRADVAFNSRWAWLNFLQYDNVTDSASINARLRWEIAPGREAFFIINYNFDADEERSLSTRAREIALQLKYTLRS